MVDSGGGCFFSIDGIGNKCQHNFLTSNDKGFMGFTHALSGVAVLAFILAFHPNLFDATIGAESVPLLILFFLVVAGGALVPDLDNTTSRAKSSLGFAGGAVSAVFRASSVVLQTSISTKYDDHDPNPHRGAWHSPFFQGILALAVYALSKNDFLTLNLPNLGKVTIGWVFSIAFTVILVHIGISGLFHKYIKKIKGSSALGEIVAIGLTLVVTLGLYSMLPETVTNVPNTWLPFGFFVGMVIHSIGDSFTTAGCPLLAPIPFKGKIWYNFRIPPHIKAGGPAENYLFIPLLSLITILSFVKILV